MAWGSRKAERVRLEHRYPVNLMGVDGTWRRSCVLLDVSATGAKLEVDGSEVGVRFIAEKKTKGRPTIPK